MVDTLAFIGLLLAAMAVGFFLAIYVHAIDPPYLLNHSDCIRISFTEEATTWRCTGGR